MSTVDRLAAIRRLEQTVDVRRLRIGDVETWPLVRDLFTRPLAREVGERHARRYGKPPTVDPLGADAPVRPAGDPARWRSGRVGDAVLVNGHDVAYPTAPVDAVVVGRSSDYQEVQDGRSLARVDDGLIATAPDGVRLVKLMRAVPRALTTAYATPPHLVVEPSGGEAWAATPVAGEAALLRAVRDLLRRARRAGIPAEHDVGLFTERLRTLVHRTAMYERVLPQLSPSLVMAASTLTLERQAALQAAKRLGLTTVDVEHGFPAPSGPYGQLGWVPPAGSPAVPDVFWTWGPAQARFLARASLPTATPHRVVIGGSPWHAHLARTGALPGPAGAAPADPPPTAGQPAGRVVLYAHQPDVIAHEDPGGLIPSALLAAVRRLGDDVALAVRLHPRARHLQAEAEAEVARAGIRRWVVAASTTEPLDRWLALADVVATSYSTVAFEANARGVPVVVCDAVGAAIMADFVAAGQLVAATDPDELAQVLRDPPRPTTVPYLDPSPDRPARAWADLLTPTGAAPR